MCMCVICDVIVPQSCLTLCDPMDCRLPGFSVHGILQARILEWVAISFSRGSFPPRGQTRVSYISCTAGKFFTVSITLQHHKPLCPLCRDTTTSPDLFRRPYEDRQQSLVLYESFRNIKGHTMAK